MVHISVLLMVKNEKKRLRVSLESVKTIANSIIIYDTGSTDNTIEIAKTFCEEYKIPLRLKEGTFVNFEVSRNVALEFADTFHDIDFILMLDTNDELKGVNELRQLCNDEIIDECSAYMLKQEWHKSGTFNSYYNVRLIKPRKGWFYKGVVHEYIMNTKNFDIKVKRVDDKGITIYQDRDQDDDKSSKRYSRDKELLLDEYKKNPMEPRTIFYLAQTYECLNDLENALYYYKIRATLGGFMEEVFHSYLRSGNIAVDLKFSNYDAIVFYLKAYDILQRAEPLIKIADIYIKSKKWKIAHSFLSLACELDYPKDSVLFIDGTIYNYTRWHLMGIVGYYADKMVDGKRGCLKALEYNPNSKTDKSNLNFY